MIRDRRGADFPKVSHVLQTVAYPIPLESTGEPAVGKSPNTGSRINNQKPGLQYQNTTINLTAIT